MPLLRPDNAPAEPTLAEKQQRAATRVKSLARNTLDAVVRNHKELLSHVFKNRQGLTPQQVFDGLGAEASEAVVLSRGLADFVNQATGETTIDTSDLPDLELNPDGTVTVVVPPEPDPE